jgi:hypothetical protein
VPTFYYYITEKPFNDVVPGKDVEVVRQLAQQLISGKIVVGHGVENDLKVRGK